VKCTPNTQTVSVSDHLPPAHLSSSPTHRTAGVATSARDGLRLAAPSTCARPGCRRRRPPAEVATSFAGHGEPGYLWAAARGGHAQTRA
jgi:hypothetical protein